MTRKSAGLRLQMNDRGMYETAPKQMTMEQLKSAIRREWQRRQHTISAQTGRANLRVNAKLRLFGTLAIGSQLEFEPPAELEWRANDAKRLVEKARSGDTLADSILREAAAIFIDRELPLPVEIRAYILDALAKPPNGSIPGEHFLRDRCIADLVLKTLTHSRERLRATRNAETRSKPSACSVVAETLNLGEKTVQRCWEKHKGEYKGRLGLRNRTKK